MGAMTSQRLYPSSRRCFGFGFGFAQRIRDSTVDPTQRRRLNDLGKPNMGLALYPAPAYLRSNADVGKTSGILLQPHQLFHAVRVRLGLNNLHSAAGECLQCGQSVRDVERHLMVCMAGGKKTLCHDAMVADVANVFHRLGCTVRTEAHPYPDRTKRMDIVATIGNGVPHRRHHCFAGHH